MRLTSSKYASECPVISDVMCWGSQTRFCWNQCDWRNGHGIKVWSCNMRDNKTSSPFFFFAAAEALSWMVFPQYNFLPYVKPTFPPPPLVPILCFPNLPLEKISILHCGERVEMAVFAMANYFCLKVGKKSWLWSLKLLVQQYCFTSH